MICDCCKNQYQDHFLSCPFCGTATAVNASEEAHSCPRCSSPVMAGQPMCQQCGLANPARALKTEPDAAVSDYREAAFGPAYPKWNNTAVQNASATDSKDDPGHSNRIQVIRKLSMASVYLAVIAPTLGILISVVAVVLSVKSKNYSSLYLLFASLIIAGLGIVSR